MPLVGAQKLTYYNENNPLKVVYPIFSKELEENKPMPKKRLNYFTFGMMLPNQVTDGTNDDQGGYRYGFQGQEMDDEIKGKGNSVNYKYRMHDTRVGRFFAVDPLTPKYPHNGPYNFSENRVIDGLELEGLEVVVLFEQTMYSAGLTIGGGGGVVIAPDGVYGFGTFNIGVETDLAVNSSAVMTVFPTMNRAEYAGGSGTTTGYTGGEGIIGGGGIATSSGYRGYYVEIGIGIGASPFGSVNHVWTLGTLTEIKGIGGINIGLEYIDNAIDANNKTISTYLNVLMMEMDTYDALGRTLYLLDNRIKEIEGYLENSELDLSEENRGTLQQYRKEIYENRGKVHNEMIELREEISNDIIEKEKKVQSNRDLNKSKEVLEKKKAEISK